MYWWYGPRQYCNIEDGDNLRTPSSELPINDCIGPQAINIFPVGSLMLRYSTVLSVNDVSNSAHMSIDESSHRASLLRDSVKDLVKTMKRQNFTVGVCLNSALVIFITNFVFLCECYTDSCLSVSLDVVLRRVYLRSIWY